MVALLPVQRFSIRSGLNAEAAMRRLAERVSPPKLWAERILDNVTGYDGAVTAMGFQLRHAPRFGRGYAAVLEGRIEASGDGSLVWARVTLGWPACVFGVIWCGVVGVPLLFFSAVSVLTVQLQPGVVLTGGMFAVGYLSMMAPFWSEVRAAETFLCGVFGAGTPPN